MRRRACPLLLGILALSFAGGCGARLDSKWQGLPPLADEPLVEQDPQIQKLADEFAKTPHSDSARLAFFQGLQRRGRRAEAVTVLASAVRDDPRNMAAAVLLLDTIQVWNVPPAAVARLCQATLADDQTNQAALWVLGELLAQGNRMQAAQDCLERAWRQEPKFWPPALSLARLSSLQGRQIEARRWCARAAQAVPEDYEAKARLAEACLQAGMVDEALASARDAARLGPRYPRSTTVLAQALLAANRPDEAVGVLSQAIAQGAAAQEKAREVGSPRDWLANLEGKQRERYWLLGEAYVSLVTEPTGPGDLDRAYRDFERARGALEKAVANTFGADTPGKVSLYLGRAYGALAAIEDARAGMASTTDGAASREELVRNLRAKAIEQYERALKGNVDSVSGDGAIVYNDLAYLYAEEGHHLDRALDLAQTAVDLASALTERSGSAQAEEVVGGCYDTLGWVQYQMADCPAAVESLVKAKELAPRSAEILWHLALAYRRDGKADQSGPLLQQALKLTEGKPSLAGLRKRIKVDLQDTKAG
jgi:tetratricopeptide (TPR) repeat protein